MHPSLTPAGFVDLLREHGFDFFAGVPCSLVKEVLGVLATRTAVPYIAATKEDSALGMAAGAAMGGKRPVVIMQNSGLGVSVNALLSLHRIYRLPCLLLITWRGYAGKDAPEHILMGPAMPGLLDQLGVPHRTLEPESSPEQVSAALAWARETLADTSSPCALLVREGALA